jgi:hypothetical protein
MTYTDDTDDDDGLEYSKIANKMQKKRDISILNKRYVTEDELDSLFLGE